MKDLLCLAADEDIEATLTNLLIRREALRIAPITFDVRVHPQRDPGCFKQGAAFLGESLAGYKFGLIVFDQAWDGAPSRVPEELEATVRAELERRGLERRADVVVIDPELEARVFSDSPHVETGLGWAGRSPPLKAWLEQQGLWRAGLPKPPDPKRAVEAALHAVRRPRSSAIYANLAAKVSVDRCVDASFARFCARLRSWFPPREG
jgi:hypothetical protein